MRRMQSIWDININAKPCLSRRVYGYYHSVEIFVFTYIIKNIWYFVTFVDKYIFIIFSCIIWFSYLFTCNWLGVYVILTKLYGAVIGTLWSVWRLIKVFIHESFANFTYYYIIVSDYMVSINNFSGFHCNIKNLVTNPLIDIDLTTNTDSEDLLVFLGDIIEFLEQDKVFLLDALFDSSLLISSVFIFEIFFLSQLKKQTLSVLLAKFFHI